MGMRLTSWSTLAIVLVPLLVASCQKGPTLDEVLEDYDRLRKELVAVTCACPEIVGVPVTFATEQECVEASGSVDLACMKQVLVDTSHEESKDIELLECYNAAIQVTIDCMRTNLEVCSATTGYDCSESKARDFDACQGPYSSTTEQYFEAGEAFEALFACYDD